eukprot:COSAG06_NODE_47513_length_338_cov_1.518828_1_plen_112_part_11
MQGTFSNLHIDADNADFGTNQSVAMNAPIVRVNASEALHIEAAFNVTVATTQMIQAATEDTTIVAADRTIVTSNHTTLNVGSTVDVSADDVRVRNSGVVDVFAAEGTRLTSA